LLVIDAETLEVTKEISVPEQPVRMSLYGLDLYVACRKGRRIVVIDIETDKITRRAELPDVPIEDMDVARMVPFIGSSHYKGRAGSPYRIVVQHPPLAFDAVSFEPAETVEVPHLYARRTTLSWESAAGAKKTFAADNMHTLIVDGSRYIDTTAVTDRHVATDDSLLGARDEPGTIRLTLDDGPARDWTRNIFADPEHRLLLAADTEQFRDFNAVRFDLAPGRHVLRVHADGAHAKLDGLIVERTPPATVSLKVASASHGEARNIWPIYQGVFGPSEKVSFDVTLAGDAAAGVGAKLFYEVRNLSGDSVDSRSLEPTSGPNEPVRFTVCPVLGAGGIYSLHLRLSTRMGSVSKTQYFVKLANLATPRLLFRAEDIGRIRARIASHPIAFKRYYDFLTRSCDRKGFLPRLLAAGHPQDPLLSLQRWRALACQFAAVFLAPKGDTRLQGRLNPLLKAPPGWNGAGISGDYTFQNALAIVLDVASAAGGRMRELARRVLSPYAYSERHFSALAACLEEPLTPRMRAVLDRHMLTVVNLARYFGAHAGTRGGNLWHGTRVRCQCTFHSIARMSLFYGNFFNEDVFFKRFFSGLYTHYDYAMPRYDVQPYFRTVPGLRDGGIGSVPEGAKYRPGDNAIRLAASGLSRNPIEKRLNRFAAEVIQKLDGPMKNETAEVDEILGKGTNVVVPLAFALGWYDPEAPEVSWEELPPSAYFDREGTVAMKSDWSEDMTDIYFVSGVRDTTYRIRPNHFRVFKAGRCLFGTASHWDDHGDPGYSWGNVVVVGDKWADYLDNANPYPRMGERTIMHRYWPELFSYAERDERMRGYTTLGDDVRFAGGHTGHIPYEIGLHGHTAHPLVAEGAILAYETSPAFDYVAGDSTNVWPVESVEEMYRQMVFVRPGLLIIYDRVLLGETGEKTMWVSARNGQSRTTGRDFLVSSEKAYAACNVLLPEEFSFKGSINIVPAKTSKRLEYLVVMNIDTGKPQFLKPELVREGNMIGAETEYRGRKVRLLFERTGAVGGKITIRGGATPVDRRLVDRVDDSYHRWKNDPRFKMWMTEKRFSFLVSEADRKKYSGRRAE